jgi:hypothetical protein
MRISAVSVMSVSPWVATSMCYFPSRITLQSGVAQKNSR